MNKQSLIQIILDQKKIPLPDPLVGRGEYEHVLPLMTNKQVIILSGIRRCGKSTLLHMIRSQAQESDYYINFDDDRLVPFELTDFDTLLDWTL